MVLPSLPSIDRRLKLTILWLLVLLLAIDGALQFAALINFQPLGVDFLPLWTAGDMAWSHPGQVYDFAAVSRAQSWLLPNLHWSRPYAYPPTALLVLAPFGKLPFWPSLTLWVALGYGVFLYAGSRLTGRRLGLSLCLMALSPAVLVAASVGQPVLPAAGLMVLAMVELERRPRLAGALMALAAAIKPQVALLAPVALIAGGSFDVLISAAVVEAILVAASVALFGPARWSEWFASLPAFEALVERTPGLLPCMITPNSAAQLLGLTGPAATLWRAFFGLFGVALVWRAFAKGSGSGVAARLGALSAGSLLATPYAMNYDGTLLVAAAVAMVIESLEQRGWVLRLLALCAVCKLNATYIGLPVVLAFAVLSSFRVKLAPLEEPGPSLAPVTLPAS